eukprot:6463981-Amphidinium_carterae.2
MASAKLASTYAIKYDVSHQTQCQQLALSNITLFRMCGCATPRRLCMARKASTPIPAKAMDARNGINFTSAPLCTVQSFQLHWSAWQTLSHCFDRGVPSAWYTAPGDWKPTLTQASTATSPKLILPPHRTHPYWTALSWAMSHGALHDPKSEDLAPLIPGESTCTELVINSQCSARNSRSQWCVPCIRTELGYTYYNPSAASLSLSRVFARPA